MNRFGLRWIAAGLTAALLVVTAGTAQAAIVYWDADGMLPVGGGTGMWDTSTNSWYNGSTYVAWVNTNNDTAVFGGTAGTATLFEAITVGGLTFNTTGYTISNGANTLTFGAANNTITLNSIAAATITGALAESASGKNVTLTAAGARHRRHVDPERHFDRRLVGHDHHQRRRDDGASGKQPGFAQHDRHHAHRRPASR